MGDFYNPDTLTDIGLKGEKARRYDELIRGEEVHNAQAQGQAYGREEGFLAAELATRAKIAEQERANFLQASDVAQGQEDLAQYLPDPQGLAQTYTN